MNKILLFIVACLCIIACNNQPTVDAPVYVTYIQGLASPIRLNFDSTRVKLSDYFADVSAIEMVMFENEKLIIDAKTGEVIITSKPASAIGNMHVSYKGVERDIPVFASEKVKHHFTYKPSSSKVKVVEMSGSMNGWNRKATPLAKEGELFTTDLILNNGLYQYRIWEDGKEMMDAGNTEKISNAMGAFNNTFIAGIVNERSPRLISSFVKPGVIEILNADNLPQVQVYFQNKLISHVMNQQTIHLHIPEEAKAMERSHIRIFAGDANQRSNDVLIPLHNGEAIVKPEELSRKDLESSVMYFAMVDRFVDGDASNNRPTPDSTILPKANNFGGDLQGITQKIKDGYFKSLGTNTIWISPISTNAEGAWGLWDKGVKSTFSAYHGYWPTALKTIDNRFGNEAAMKELIAVAHENNMNVILDYVAHHVHQNHPLYKEKPEWTTPLYLPDGTMNTEKWDEHRLTTWFDTFLPTWNFANHEVVEALTDSAMYWVENYDLDGFRHDATKHITEDFWRTLTKKVKSYTALHPERKIYQVGETYGSPGLISSYINSGELDAQFDFNLYDAAVDAFAKDETSFANLGRVLKESLNYYGSHHVMGNITGNQDRARFTSYADGSVKFSEDAKLAGWTRDIQNNGESGFQKMIMLNVFLMTTPGIPCVYYGDEIGMPGGNDPDNRRMMHFDDLNPDQQKTKDTIAKLIKLRRENLPFTFGDTFILKNDDEALVYVRSYLGQNAIVVIDKKIKKGESWSVEIPENLRSMVFRKFGQSAFLIDNGVLTFRADAGEVVNAFEIFY